MDYKEHNRREKVAKEGYDLLEKIFSLRDLKTECITRATYIGKDGAMHGVITFRTEGKPFTSLDERVVVNNLILVGGFDDIEVEFERGNTEISIFSYVGGKPVAKAKRVA